MNETVKEVYLKITGDDGTSHEVNGKVTIKWIQKRGNRGYGSYWTATDYPRAEEETTGRGGSWTEAITDWAMQKIREAEA